MTKHLGQDIVTFKSHSYIDIFWGKESWAPHARFLIKHTPKGKVLLHISGNKPPKHIFQHALTEVQ